MMMFALRQAEDPDDDETLESMEEHFAYKFGSDWKEKYEKALEEERDEKRDMVWRISADLTMQAMREIEDSDPFDWQYLEEKLIGKYGENWKEDYENAIIELEEYDKSSVQTN